jgi:hypothetical protein
MSALLEFEIKNGPNVEKCWVEEGDFSELKTYGVNRKYTHHCVAVIQELREDKSFRHLSLPQICEAVCQHGVRRGHGWHRVYGEIANIMHNREANEYDVDATKKALARECGVSCWLCGSLIDKGERWMPFTVKSKNDGRLGFGMAALFRQPYDIVCQKCLSVARPTLVFGDEKISELTALNKYLMAEINKAFPAKKGKRK